MDEGLIKRPQVPRHIEPLMAICRWHGQPGCLSGRTRPADMPPWEPTFDCGTPECKERTERYREELR